jgi:NADH-quinone oxidoreductase subunit M
MSTWTAPIALIGLLPALFAILALRPTTKPRTFAVVGSGVSLLGPLALAAHLGSSKGEELVDGFRLSNVPVFGVDSLSISMMLAAGVALVVVMLSARPRELTPKILSAAFATQALAFTTYAIAHEVVLLVVWCAVGLPTVLALRGTKNARSTAILLGLTAAPLAVVAVVDPTAQSLAFDDVVTPSAGLCLAVLGAALGRMGLVPFHSWLAPVLAETESPVALPIVASCTGPYLLARFAEPIAAWSTRGLSFVGTVAVVGAVYMALLALAERRFRHAIACIVMSQSGLVLAGLSSGDPESVRGALMFSVAESFAAIGLLVAARAVEARVGAVDLTSHHGLSAPFPKLATTYLVFTLATIGFPGFASYTAEDMILEGSAHRHILVSIALAAVAALNGFTAFRAYGRVFLGPAPRGAMPGDLLDRKRFLFAAILLGQLVFGLTPIARRLPLSMGVTAPHSTTSTHAP